MKGSLIALSLVAILAACTRTPPAAQAKSAVPAVPPATVSEAAVATTRPKLVSL